MFLISLLLPLGCQSDPVADSPDFVCPKDYGASEDTDKTSETDDTGILDTGTPQQAGPTELPAVAGYAFQQVLGGLEFPVDLVEVGDGTLLIAGKLGQLVRVDLETHTLLDSLRVDELMTLPTDVEQGLLSISLHPDFADGGDPHLYSWQTTIHAQQNSLIRWDLELEPLTLSNPVEVLAIEKYETGMATHNGGQLVWWEGESDEPVLYLSVGNGGGPGNNPAGQAMDHPSAGVLAMTIDTAGTPIPAFQSPFEHELLVAKGLRNPWRMIDCGDVLCIGDVGESYAEELNLYTGVGNNFGHGTFEGPSDGTHDDPFTWYAHGDEQFGKEDPDYSQTRGESIMVGARVSGKAYDGRLEDFVLYADIYQGWVRGVYLGESEDLQGVDLHLAHQAVLGAMIELEDGTVYAVEMMGTLRRLVAVDDIPTVGTVGEALSDTAFSDGGLEYTVRYPLWSNGTIKERLIQLPEGTTIDTSDPEHWVYPVGTRSYKTFFWNEQPVETRLLEKTEKGWASGIYVWSDDGSEALLTDGSETEPQVSMDIPYTIPATGACTLCHGNAQDMLLGLDPFQLGSNGIELFEPTLSAPVDVPIIDDTELGIAARGYLHSNCSICHQGASVTGVNLDLSFSSHPSEFSGEGMYYYPEVPFLDPGTPQNSAIFKAIAEQVMPPVALSVMDATAVETLGAWIEELGELE